MILFSQADFFFQNHFFKIFQEHYQPVKWFGSRSGLTFDLGPNCLQRLSADDKSLCLHGKSSNSLIFVAQFKGLDKHCRPSFFYFMYVMVHSMDFFLRNCFFPQKAAKYSIQTA